MSNDTSYEAIPYENYAFPGTHPNRLAGLLRLHGGSAPAPESARILELGCAAGANLLPMGLQLPGATLIGVDLSTGQVAAGEQLRMQAGIDNVSLRCANVMDIDPSWGQFDYIIMHGLFSHVPLVVRDKLLAICRDHLTPGGGAYIGFNVMPGWQFNGSVRHMLLEHVTKVDNPVAQVAKARQFLAFLATHATQDARGQQLRELATRLADRPDAYVFHEYLESDNHPLTFGEFVALADAHGLRYVADSTPTPIGPFMLPPATATAIASLADGDKLRAEAIFDQLTGRTLRCALLTTSDSPATPTPHAEHLDRLHIGLVVRPDGPPVGPMQIIDQPQVLADGRKIRMTAGNNLYRAAFGLLAQASPQAVAFEQLLSNARALSASHSSVDDDRRILRAELSSAITHGIAEPLVGPWRCGAVGNNPTISALARAQAAAGHGITTYQHKQLFPPARVRALMPAMDGTRTTEALIDLALHDLVAAPGVDMKSHRQQTAASFANVIAYLRGHALF